MDYTCILEKVLSTMYNTTDPDRHFLTNVAYYEKYFRMTKATMTDEMTDW